MLIHVILSNLVVPENAANLSPYFIPSLPLLPPPLFSPPPTPTYLSGPGG